MPANVIFPAFLIFSYFALEMLGRQGGEARSLRGGESDQGSTRLIVFALISGILVVPLLAFAGVGWFHAGDFLAAPLVVLGIVLMVAGLVIRVWALRTLRQFYTRTLLISQAHRLVRDGPYRAVRHPGYLGTLLVWLGYGLASANWIAIAYITLVILLAYLYRIHSEEAMLVARFGDDYRAYQQRTKRLIPFVY